MNTAKASTAVFCIAPLVKSEAVGALVEAAEEVERVPALYAALVSALPSLRSVVSVSAVVPEVYGVAEAVGASAVTVTVTVT